MSDQVIDSEISRPVFSDDKEVFQSEVVAVISSIREELDDHRQAINENTSETESNFDFLVEIARRVDALSERLDAISLQIGRDASDKPDFHVGNLTSREKRVFTALYALTEDNPEVSYSQVASRAGCTEELVAGHISRIISKGVPLKKRYVAKQVRLSIDPRFRQEQAKSNLVQLDAPLTAWM